MFHLNAVFDALPFFSDAIFLLRPLIALSLPVFHEVLFSTDAVVSFVILLEVDECMCDRLYGANLALSIVVPISVIDSFRRCMASDSDVSLWSPVITESP